MEQARAEAVERYPPLEQRLREKLALIAPSDAFGFPCLVDLKDGTTCDCVYLAPAITWFEHWGVWPEDDPGKSALPLSEVADIRESPSRVPPEIAQSIYQAGESGMGYHVFTLTFRDGSRTPFGTGRALDFLDLPEGKGPADIASVAPHTGRRELGLAGTLPYHWCLFSQDLDLSRTS
jgi:hypothetical protein